MFLGFSFGKNLKPGFLKLESELKYDPVEQKLEIWGFGFDGSSSSIVKSVEGAMELKRENFELESVFCGDCEKVELKYWWERWEKGLGLEFWGLWERK